ncbi:hypothetical protein C4D39_03275 [Clostridium perfringens]|uniref:hypothetical protein n=1 Tax=Clostridium perfringens TaxID=1502 RepID=UPI00204594F5|nr:MAG TPA: hypothetical protein [Caudoviricetes sp.]
MKFNELEKKQQNHINGVLAKYMDQYIRNHLVWTPEQMYSEFMDMITERHNNGNYGGIYYINGKEVCIFKEGEIWLVSDEGKKLIKERFAKKYNKNKKLASKKSPLMERVRFGFNWDKERYFDINYGLKGGYNFQKMDLVENLEVIPWSIEHVEDELEKKYNGSLKDVLKKLSNSPIEKMFYEEWIRRYYKHKEKPALIPEFCGGRKKFYCCKDDKGNYNLNRTSFYDKAVNVRFDFAVINFKKQKKLLIELDGHDYHKSKDQRINDSIKRTIATNNGWQMNVITGSQIYRDINEVFNSMREFFE